MPLLLQSLPAPELRSHSSGTALSLQSFAMSWQSSGVPSGWQSGLYFANGVRKKAREQFERLSVS